MKSKALKYVDSLVNDDTPKGELDTINYIKKCIREYKEPERKLSTFALPTRQEIEEYVALKGYKVDIDRFVEYYEASGWHDSNGKKVKNWKLKLLVWNKPQGNNYTFKGKGTQGVTSREYSSEELNSLFDDLDNVEF
ncbi:MAG: hypothetical protein ACI4PF_00085 [Christensenellales bacterium]